MIDDVNIVDVCEVARSSSLYNRAEGDDNTLLPIRLCISMRRLADARAALHQLLSTILMEGPSVCIAMCCCL